ncbi:MAG: tetratricopeptide repeat protein [Acidobacteriaceae bacterium]|nr:tetratricopeptide repeat protein [Acidobacteriaceae bacterium]
MRYLLLTVVALIAAGQNRPTLLSPAQQRIDAAEKRVQANPQSWQAYNDLALALCRKGRDSGDVAFYDEAEKAVQRSLQFSPGNWDARKLEVTVLLGKHEFAQALKQAAELNHQAHDDIGVWGLLVDANVALGNYDEAERDAQWILDLRRGSALGFEKAAGLRELFGDIEGAIEFFRETDLRTSQNDTDQRAWLLTQIARLQLALGNAKVAGELLDQVAKLNPDSQLALATRAKLQMAEGHYAEAVASLRKRCDALPSSGNLYDLADALERNGRKEEALAAFQEFETKARAEMAKAFNSNLDLIYFYADHKNNPAEALALATQEIKIRHDSPTLDAYAWALYRNGKYSEAKTQMDRALAVGIRDPVYFCHAATIASGVNDTASANRFQKELATMDGNTCTVATRVQTARGATP